ncbi:DUF4177 domain-containing protein [Ruegeria sp. 2205SS24-7]|uniref:DUF4177 domain-containing protein n=1 Tax=Ruegeria discodermiae TaxID=3064389 RepID=UPI002741A94E|nr:DUF4177 domain-containing protein [Ruegeria sp. 2205SS24-7]MDP5217800.1 DUF4177 domain-containing protein [Ruegeria sp. 2205SS24-7]
MARYEYKVVPAPAKGTKAKGIKTPEGRFALSVEELLNLQAAEGWEYQRAELLPSEEKSGLTGSTTNWRNVLIFRRLLDAEDERAVLVAQPLEAPKHDADGIPIARPIPGPEDTRAPAPIAEEVNDPPLNRPENDAGTRTPPLVVQPSAQRDKGGSSEN